MYNTMKLNITFFIFMLLFSTYSFSLQVRSIYDVMLHNNEIRYYKCYEPIFFEYQPFPLAHHSYFHPHKGCFDQSGIFIIPKGKAYGEWGMVHDHNNCFIKEFHVTTNSLYKYVSIIHNTKFPSNKIKKFTGKVAVITSPGFQFYGHWIGDILAKFALLEMKNIQYDWLYVPQTTSFMKETLSLLDVDPAKIINPYDDVYIQADELIVPSSPAKFIPLQANYAQEHFKVLYFPKWHITWLQQTFLPLLRKHNHVDNFCEKVFISRQDASNRKILNEDEIFHYFEQKGFIHYNLSEMSFMQQINLFHQAKYIVSPHGSGLTNIIFCNPKTCVLEIFQNQFDATFWYLSEMLHLEHHCIRTQNAHYLEDAKSNTIVSLAAIEQYINENLPNL
tara:strand:+ start:4111 stop:5280 length:1170 start_codon:yes stop_codon:yes gene_type:complete